MAQNWSTMNFEMQLAGMLTMQKESKSH